MKKKAKKGLDPMTKKGMAGESMPGEGSGAPAKNSTSNNPASKKGKKPARAARY